MADEAASAFNRSSRSFCRLPGSVGNQQAETWSGPDTSMSGGSSVHLSNE